MRAEGKTIAHCHGYYNVLHPGHIKYLEHGKELGDVLVVTVIADSVIDWKEDGFFVPEELRLGTVAALEMVDYVCLVTDSWAGPILRLMRPDYYVKGNEYEHVFTGKFGDERKIVDEYGGKVVFSRVDTGFPASSVLTDFRKEFSADFEAMDFFLKRNDITYEKSLGLMRNLANKKVIVIGEVILDEYNHNDLVSAAGEAPILTVKYGNKECFVGGAGIVSKHIRSLGGDPMLFSLLGEDREADYLLRNLDENGINRLILRNKDVTTIRKVRHLVQNQKLLKVDYSQDIYLTEKEEQQIINGIVEHDDAGCIVVVDFGYGFVTDKLRAEIMRFGSENKIPIIADTSGASGGNILKYEDVYLITPTEREGRQVLNDQESGLSVIGHHLIETTKSENVLLTLGGNGVLLVNNRRFHLTEIEDRSDQHLVSEYVPAMGRGAIDSMGAGDAMLAMIALVVASRGPTSLAIYLGGIAAYLETCKVGNKVIHQNEIMNYLAEHLGRGLSRIDDTK
jgi:rfaE bifunctional protein kinase chain/domain